MHFFLHRRRTKYQRARRWDLFTGDPGTGQERTKILTIDAFCAPSDVTWHSEQRRELASYTYASPGPHTASLRWGDALDSVTIDLGREADHART